MKSPQHNSGSVASLKRSLQEEKAPGQNVAKKIRLDPVSGVFTLSSGQARFYLIIWAGNKDN